MGPNTFLCAAWTVLLAAGGTHPLSGDQPAPVKLTEDEQAILDATNRAREKEGLPPLRLDAALAKAAREHAKNMAGQGKMAHVLDGKKPEERVKDAGYDYSWTGENIAWATDLDPAGTVKGWMNSPHHRENILRKQFREIGIGIARSAKGEYYYAQVFGSPRRRR